MSIKAANRYAKAFLDTAIEMDVVEQVKEDMLMISDTFSSSPELGSFVRSPIVRGEKKKAALGEIFNGKIEDITRNLLSVLSGKNRERLLEEITHQFLKLYNSHKGIIEVNVVSAFELSAKQVDELDSELEATTGKKILLHTYVDQDLMGGLKVMIDDTVIDGTVKHKLSRLRDRFTLTGI